VAAHPQVAMSIVDPDNPYKYLEVRGDVERIDPDPDGDFYMHLNNRYSGPFSEPPPDHPDRVVFVVRPTSYSKQ
jgi:hypothetical protein